MTADSDPNAPLTGSTPLLNIAAVERETRIAKDTLRVWERRYGFPDPQRDANGERLYPLDQVTRLRTVKRLLDAGHRPGRVVPLDPVALQRLDAVGEPAAQRVYSNLTVAAAEDALAELLALVHAHDPQSLRRVLTQRLLGQGLARFVAMTAVPLVHAIGREWSSGRMAVFEEHLASDGRARQGASPRSTGAVQRLAHALAAAVHRVIPGAGVAVVAGRSRFRLAAATAARSRLVRIHRAQVVAVRCSVTVGVRVRRTATASTRRDLGGVVGQPSRQSITVSPSPSTSGLPQPQRLSQVLLRSVGQPSSASQVPSPSVSVYVPAQLHEPSSTSLSVQSLLSSHALPIWPGTVGFDLKPESAHLFIHAFSNGEIERMEAGRITGLAERTARDVLNTLVLEGFLVSESPRG